MKLVTTVALASLTLAATADAADLFGAAPATIPASSAPTAVEIGSNWYLRGDIGVSFEPAPTVSLTPTLAALAGDPDIPRGVATWGGGDATNVTAGLGFGYRFNDFLRFDATWDYWTGPSARRSTAFLCGDRMGDPAGVCYGAANTAWHGNTFLANAYVDLGAWSGVTPYVGAGVGASFVSTQTSLDYSQSLLAPPFAPAGPWGGTINRTDTGFAWALMGGLSYQLTPSVLIDLGYRYLDGGVSRTSFDLVTGTSVKRSVASQQVRVGLRYLIQ